MTDEPIDLNAIEARANAAGGNESKWVDAGVRNLVSNSYGHDICRTLGDPAFQHGYMRHIAGMDPATTLRLVAELREWRQFGAACRDAPRPPSSTGSVPLINP